METNLCGCQADEPRCAPCIKEYFGCTDDEAKDAADILRKTPDVSASTVMSALLGKAGNDHA